MCHLSQTQEKTWQRHQRSSAPGCYRLEAETLVPAGWLRIDCCLIWTGEGKFCQVTGQITLADDAHKDATGEPYSFPVQGRCDCVFPASEKMKSTEKMFFQKNHFILCLFAFIGKLTDVTRHYFSAF